MNFAQNMLTKINKLLDSRCEIDQGVRIMRTPDPTENELRDFAQKTKAKKIICFSVATPEDAKDYRDVI